MNQLEEIKARAEKAAEARRNYDGETGSESIMLAFIAEQSSYDVPKLLAALEAVLEACTKVDRESSEAEQDWLAWAIETAIKEALQ